MQLFWLIYLFLISSTCFGQWLRPSSGALDCIYSFWYCPTILMLAGVIDEMELTYSQFHLIHQWTVSEAVNTVKCSLWWAKTSPETCRADWVQINKPKICILLVINYEKDVLVTVVDILVSWYWMRTVRFKMREWKGAFQICVCCDIICSLCNAGFARGPFISQHFYLSCR